MGDEFYNRGLNKNRANYTPLSPVAFLRRAADVHPQRVSVVSEDRQFTWEETRERCCQFARALLKRGIKRNDAVSVIAPNVPALYEAHFGVPMALAVLNAINTRLDSPSIGRILLHCSAQLILVDETLIHMLADALLLMQKEKRIHPDGPSHLQIIVISIQPGMLPDLSLLGDAAPQVVDYEQFLEEGRRAPADVSDDWPSLPDSPVDEWDAIALGYTSGTTSHPKGVVTSHRGAYLSSLSNVINWGLPPSSSPHPCVYLWTLPLFHCNGWCFPWAVAAVAGTNICTRQVTAEGVFSLILKHNVTHFCAAPVVLNFIINAPEALRTSFLQSRQNGQSPPPRIHVMTAGAAPPPSVLAGMEAMGFEVLHTYGLTETYGPSVFCEWQPAAWDGLSAGKRAEVKARQGVRYLALDDLAVMDPATMRHVASDGRSIGEVMMRGNMVMRGYAANAGATAAAFAGGWFHSGDLAVQHPDGYIEIKDRSKDIIITGGENVSSIEVEAVLYRHPAVLEAAVVARPDDTWGETVCAFVGLKEGSENVTEGEIISFCRSRLPHYMAPRSVIFSMLPKTATGKVQKFVLRDIATKSGSLRPSKL